MSCSSPSGIFALFTQRQKWHDNTDGWCATQQTIIFIDVNLKSVLSDLVTHIVNKMWHHTHSCTIDNLLSVTNNASNVKVNMSIKMFNKQFDLQNYIVK